jgi:SAM-dependent methyltransferase
MSEGGAAAIPLRRTTCAVCGGEAADEVCAATFDDASFNERVFSARRLPDRVHYRMVRCRGCGLVRSDPVADQATLAGLYERSGFDYAAEVPNLRRTYGRYLARARRWMSPPPSRLLEVGCGSGFVLEEALAAGFEAVRGVEPSRDAVASAGPAVRQLIVPDAFRPGIFAAGEFDLVCMFQVFDHLPAPGLVLDECRRVLAPGGLLLLLHHNVRSLSARLLGVRSPIIDIEHCYLYSPRTMRLLLLKHGFGVVEAGAASNTLSLRHLAHLLPLPTGARARLLEAMAGRPGRLSLRLPLGNLYVIARRAGRDGS